MAATAHLLYLHGFRSSPQSTKAQQTARWMRAHRPEVHWWCPQLPAAPNEVLQMLREGTADWPRETMAVIGSSLGGFFATVLAETTGCRAVVLNPAVNPARDLAQHVGQQPSWHDPSVLIDVRPEFGAAFHAMTPGPLQHPERYFALIAKGDEVLDWREMTARYAGAHITLLEGGDHALSDFDRHLPEVLRFLALA
ncbi:MAG: YqiA/YcfP family alpha/beta fold hydrolase [Burkholderiales bacterium]